MILKFKSPLGLILEGSVTRIDTLSKWCWIGKCGTIGTQTQQTPGRAAGQLRKAMKRAGFEEVKS
jgi:hypothetical protein